MQQVMAKHGTVRGKARVGTPVWRWAAKLSMENEKWSTSRVCL